MSHVIPRRGHHRRDVGDHDGRADPAFDALMTSMLYPDLQNWNCASPLTFRGDVLSNELGNDLNVLH
jgi:hypothetical protein